MPHASKPRAGSRVKLPREPALGLEAWGIQISMIAGGRPIENAYAERLIRTLKELGDVP